MIVTTQYRIGYQEVKRKCEEHVTKEATIILSMFSKKNESSPRVTVVLHDHFSRTMGIVNSHAHDMGMNKDSVVLLNADKFGKRSIFEVSSNEVTNANSSRSSAMPESQVIALTALVELGKQGIDPEWAAKFVNFYLRESGQNPANANSINFKVSPQKEDKQRALVTLFNPTKVAQAQMRKALPNAASDTFFGHKYKRDNEVMARAVNNAITQRNSSNMSQQNSDVAQENNADQRRSFMV